MLICEFQKRVEMGFEEDVFRRWRIRDGDDFGEMFLCLLRGGQEGGEGYLSGLI